MPLNALDAIPVGFTVPNKENLSGHVIAVRVRGFVKPNSERKVRPFVNNTCRQAVLTGRTLPGAEAAPLATPTFG
ncbi:hypothetical protein PBS_50870 [Paraburkholderia sp. 2C]